MTTHRNPLAPFAIVNGNTYHTRDGRFAPLPPADGGPFGDQVELPEDAWIGYEEETRARLAGLAEPGAYLIEIDDTEG